MSMCVPSPNAILRGTLNRFAQQLSSYAFIKMLLHTIELNTAIRACFQHIRSHFVCIVCILSEIKSNKMKVRAWLLINVICVGVLLTGTIWVLSYDPPTEWDILWFFRFDGSTTSPVLSTEDNKLRILYILINHYHHNIRWQFVSFALPLP